MLEILRRLFGIHDKVAKVLQSRTTPPRERLLCLFKIETDKAEYLVFETETVDYDWVNIEIEEVRDGKRKLILKDEIFEDSCGAMGGTAFSGLIIDAMNHLRDYIKEKKEVIIEETDCLKKKKQNAK